MTIQIILTVYVGNLLEIFVWACQTHAKNHSLVGLITIGKAKRYDRSCRELPAFCLGLGIASGNSGINGVIKKIRHFMM
jgi:hypothetical protein